MKLSTVDVDARLAKLPSWTKDGDAIKRQFTFEGFPDAIAFIMRLAFDAEAADHHPDLLLNYKRVTVTWTTHDQGGLTEKDFAGAAKANEYAGRLGSVD